jgi:NADH-quinone oxidoreductase subunit J
MSSLGTFFFCACAAVAVLSACGAVASRTPIRAAMSLLAHILSLAGLYLALHAQLLAAMQLIVYAGAVVVLFVFVIMLIGPTEEPRRLGIHGAAARVLSMCLMAAVAISLAAGVGHLRPVAPTIEGCSGGVPECAQFGGVEGVARVLYRDAVVPFELISILLLVAILGAIVVARGRTVAEAKRFKAEREAKAGALPTEASAAGGE